MHSLPVSYTATFPNPHSMPCKPRHEEVPPGYYCYSHEYYSPHRHFFSHHHPHCWGQHQAHHQWWCWWRCYLLLTALAIHTNSPLLRDHARHRRRNCSCFEMQTRRTKRRRRRRRTMPCLTALAISWVVPWPMPTQSLWRRHLGGVLARHKRLGRRHSVVGPGSVLVKQNEGDRQRCCRTTRLPHGHSVLA